MNRVVKQKKLAKLLVLQFEIILKVKKTVIKEMLEKSFRD